MLNINFYFPSRSSLKIQHWHLKLKQRAMVSLGGGNRDWNWGRWGSFWGAGSQREGSCIERKPRKLHGIPWSFGQILSWACVEWWDLVQNSYLEAMNRKKKKKRHLDRAERYKLSSSQSEGWVLRKAVLYE